MKVKDYIARIKKPTYIKIVDDKTLYYHGRSDRPEIERWFNKKVLDMEVNVEYMTPQLVLYVEPPKEIKLGELIGKFNGRVCIRVIGKAAALYYEGENDIPESLHSYIVQKISSQFDLTEVYVKEA